MSDNAAIGRRIEARRNELGLTLDDVATSIGVARSTIQRYEKGKINKLKLPVIEAIASVLYVNPAWLCYKSDNMEPSHEPPSRGVKVPVLGTVAAGIPIEAVEEILDYEEITPQMAACGEYFALQIRGSSMEPRMVEGDVVIVRQQSDVDSGDIAVVLVNGNEATVKKIRKQENGLSLIPSNPSYDVMFFTPQEVESLPVRIIGKVVELRAKM